MAPLTEQQLEGEYRKWVNSLPKDQKKAVKAQGLDKPAPAFPSSHKHGGGYEGLQVSRQSQTSEPDAMKLALIARDFYELTPVCGVTPLDEIIESEENEQKNASEISKEQIARLKADTVSAMLSYLFTAVNNKPTTPVDVASKVYLLAYTVNPSLIHGWTLERIADCWDSTKAAFSKRRIKQDAELNIHARNAKSTLAVSRYREGTKQWWSEKKAAEKAAKRKEYLAAWRKANAAEVKAYQKLYRTANRERLLVAKRKARKH